MNAPKEVAVPPAVVTVTSLAPAVPAGVFAVIVVESTTTMLVAPTPPIFTLSAPVKLVPLMVTAVAPAKTPVFGLMESMVGSGVP